MKNRRIDVDELLSWKRQYPGNFTFGYDTPSKSKKSAPSSKKSVTQDSETKKGKKLKVSRTK